MAMSGPPKTAESAGSDRQQGSIGTFPMSESESDASAIMSGGNDVVTGMRDDDDSDVSSLSGMKESGQCDEASCTTVSSEGTPGQQRLPEHPAFAAVDRRSGYLPGNLPLHHMADSDNSAPDYFEDEEVGDVDRYKNGWTGYVHDKDGDDKSFHSSSTASSSSSASYTYEMAHRYIKKGRFFKVMTSLYSERKLVVLCLAHVAATFVVWSHFALIKYRMKQEAFDRQSHKYWWKVLIPAVEFGTMHAVLLQMAVIPLTMSRLTIVMASSSSIHKIIPLNRMLNFHIVLGYVMVAVVTVSSAIFVFFFKTLCDDGDWKFCSKLRNEIMITGYALLGLLLVVGLTSYFRERMPYEVFYVVHHLVFVLYILCTAHTLDNHQRQHIEERAQTFKWYSATLLFYLVDRAALRMNHSYRTSVVASSVVTGGKKAKMVILTLLKPTLFKFKPGQYAYLKVRDISKHQYHPFSISSAPGSDYLEFYIEVHGPKSWTFRLWNMMQEFERTGRRVAVEVLGPCGTPLGNPEEYSHCLAIGSGTGIVPIISLFKQHVRQLLRLDPDVYLREQVEHHEKIYRIYQTNKSQRGTILSKICKMTACRKTALAAYAIDDDDDDDHPAMMRRSSSSSKEHVWGIPMQPRHLNSAQGNTTAATPMTLAQVQSRAWRAASPMYGMSILMFLPAFGVAMVGLTISINTTPATIFWWMPSALKVGTIAFQVCFGIFVLCFQPSASFQTYVDVAFFTVSLFSDWYWFKRDAWGHFRFADCAYYVILWGYMTASVWFSAVKSRTQSSWRTDVVGLEGRIMTLDKLHMVWVTRSAALVSEIVPDINEIWTELCNVWGREWARKVCAISIYVTDEDDVAVSSLKSQVRQTPLYRSGALRFRRPNLQQLLEKHTVDRIQDSDRIPTSSTLICFCGSPNLSAHVRDAKISNDISTMVTGHRLHQMEFVSESYGASREQQSRRKNKPT